MPLILQNLFEETAPNILNDPRVLRILGASIVDAPNVRTGWDADNEAWITYPLRGQRSVMAITIELLPKDSKKEVWEIKSIELDMNNGKKLELKDTVPLARQSFNIRTKHQELVKLLLKRQEAMKQQQLQKQQRMHHQ